LDCLKQVVDEVIKSLRAYHKPLFPVWKTEPEAVQQVPTQQSVGMAAQNTLMDGRL
jgi:hypothetical protein